MPATVNRETVRQYKAQMRAYDAERLRLNLVTAREINSSNSAVPWNAVFHVRTLSRF
jgi:hypothetical protein